MEKKKKKENLEASRTEVSLDVVKDEVLPAIESWSVVIGCCKGWSVADDRELKHRDWNWSVAGRSRRVAGVWIVAIGSELKRCQCLKRAEALSTFEVKCRNQDRQRRWQCAGFWERMGWVSFGNEEGNDVNDKWNWKIKLSGSFSGL